MHEDDNTIVSVKYNSNSDTWMKQITFVCVMRHQVRLDYMAN